MANVQKLHIGVKVLTKSISYSDQFLTLTINSLKMKRQLKVLIMVIFIVSCAKSQEKKSIKQKIGGPCDGCEAIYEYGTKTLNAVDTLPSFLSAQEKVKITGVVYQIDGKTPAKNILLYAYQTNEQGTYPKRNISTGWEKRHGYIRGWIKTDTQGRYTLYTFRPASYPDTRIAQHIHMTVKEPDRNAYYIDNFYFDDDPNLTDKIRNRSNFRCGSGILRLLEVNGMFRAKRDIILGKNIPNYD